jgi:hypothetical protein
LHILRKFKTTSILVVLGLTAAFTVFLAVAIQCLYDFSYNRNFKAVYVHNRTCDNLHADLQGGNEKPCGCN